MYKTSVIFVLKFCTCTFVYKLCFFWQLEPVYISPKFFQIQGKYYYRIDPLGEGAKWRRSLGQEIYSPLLLAIAQEVSFFLSFFFSSLFIPVLWICLWLGTFSWQDGDNWMSSHVPTFSGIDSSYSLPDNVAVITLQVDDVSIHGKHIIHYFVRLLN